MQRGFLCHKAGLGATSAKAKSKAKAKGVAEAPDDVSESDDMPPSLLDVSSDGGCAGGGGDGGGGGVGGCCGDSIGDDTSSEDDLLNKFGAVDAAKLAGMMGTPVHVWDHRSPSTYRIQQPGEVCATSTVTSCEEDHATNKSQKTKKNEKKSQKKSQKK